MDDRRLDEHAAVDGCRRRFGCRVARDGREEVDAAQELDRHRFVEPHPVELGFGEAAGLVEQLVRHDELADVVHERCVAETLGPPRAERELLRDVRGERRDPLRVTGRVPILRLERPNQRLDRVLLRRLELQVARERLHAR